MVTEYKIALTDLAARRSAALLRAKVEDSLCTGTVVLDFSTVENVSESYADELFGVLVETRGLSWVFERLTFKGLRPVVARSIAASIRFRLSRAEGGDASLALLAAQDALNRKHAIANGFRH